MGPIKRPNHVHIMFSDDEARELQTIAGENRLTLSDMIRRLVRTECDNLLSRREMQADARHGRQSDAWNNSRHDRRR
jgi:hypothetical protein